MFAMSWAKLALVFVLLLAFTSPASAEQYRYVTMPDGSQVLASIDGVPVRTAQPTTTGGCTGAAPVVTGGCTGAAPVVTGGCTGGTPTTVYVQTQPAQVYVYVQPQPQPVAYYIVPAPRHVGTVRQTTVTRTRFRLFR